MTLKSGIERMLMHYIPEVKGVEQVRIPVAPSLDEPALTFFRRFWTRRKRSR